MPPATPVEVHAIYTGLNLPAHDRASPEKGTAMRGTVLLAVPTVHLVDGETISVPCAVPVLTLPNSATLSRNLLSVNTPFVPDEWEKMLNSIVPFNRFSDVPSSMRSGFDMGARTPPTYTFTPPNHKSATLFPDHVLSHIQKELHLGRYTGPFSRSALELLIGPFRSSPLGTVPKSPYTTDRRVVQDLSFPRNDLSISSINSQINIDEFRCDSSS
jgi:hypothetical protein